MTTAPDYSALQEEGPDDAERLAKIAELSKLAPEVPKALAKVAAAEAALKSAQEEAAQLLEQRIPDLMEELGMKEYPLRDGGTLVCDEKIRASIPVAFASRAFAWLREHGHGPIIKRQVKLDFGMGEEQKATDLVAELKAQGLRPEDKETVHPSTLASFVREQLGEGRDLPMELFGVMRQRFTKLKV